MRIVVVTIITLLSINFTNATTYIVGDGLKWVEPPTPTIYSIWASTHVFAQGDILVFNFNTGIHNVAEVTKNAYNICNTSDLLYIHNKSPVSISLAKKGTRYFISTLNNDCRNGQKLAINVLEFLPPPLPPPEIAPQSDNPALPMPAAAPKDNVTPLPPSKSSAATLYTSFGFSFLFVFASFAFIMLS